MPHRLLGELKEVTAEKLLQEPKASITAEMTVVESEGLGLESPICCFLAGLPCSLTFLNLYTPQRERKPAPSTLQAVVRIKRNEVQKALSMVPGMQDPSARELLRS